jgi:hypothetical protein
MQLFKSIEITAQGLPLESEVFVFVPPSPKEGILYDGGSSEGLTREVATAG